MHAGKIGERFGCRRELLDNAVSQSPGLCPGLDLIQRRCEKNMRDGEQIWRPEALGVLLVEALTGLVIGLGQRYVSCDHRPHQRLFVGLATTFTVGDRSRL